MALGSLPASTATLSAAGPTITLDFTKSKSSTDAKNQKPKMESPQVHEFLVEKMATSLTKDPKFTAALAAAMLGKFLHRNPTEKW